MPVITQKWVKRSDPIAYNYLTHRIRRIIRAARPHTLLSRSDR